MRPLPVGLRHSSRAPRYAPPHLRDAGACQACYLRRHRLRLVHYLDRRCTQENDASASQPKLWLATDLRAPRQAQCLPALRRIAGHVHPFQKTRTDVTGGSAEWKPFQSGRKNQVRAVHCELRRVVRTAIENPGKVHWRPVNGALDTQRGAGRGAAQSDALYSWSVPWPSCPNCGFPAEKTRPLQSHMVKSIPAATLLALTITAFAGFVTSSAAEAASPVSWSHASVLSASEREVAAVASFGMREATGYGSLPRLPLHVPLHHSQGWGAVRTLHLASLPLDAADAQLPLQAKTSSSLEAASQAAAAARCPLQASRPWEACQGSGLRALGGGDV